MRQSRCQIDCAHLHNHRGIFILPVASRLLDRTEEGGDADQRRHSGEEMDIVLAVSTSPHAKHRTKIRRKIYVE